MGFLGDIWTSFVLGVLTPLTALCVLPLYPAFLARLAQRVPGEGGDRRLLVRFGLLVVAGVILFMTLLGLLFTTLLQESLTAVIGVVSPIAFGILFFARTATISGFVENQLSFLAFGLGIGAPLLLFSLVSRAGARSMVRVLVRLRRPIEITAGLVMATVSLYYLAYVFHVVPLLN